MNTTQNTTPKVANVFSSSRGGFLNWDDEPAANQPHQPHQEHEPETDDSQSIDSDHSSNFWHNWSPTVDRMIVARHATYLKELEAQIAVGEATLQKVREQIKSKHHHPTGSSPANPAARNQGANGGSTKNNKNQALTPTDSTQGFQPVPATTF